MNKKLFLELVVYLLLFSLVITACGASQVQLDPNAITVSNARKIDAMEKFGDGGYYTSAAASSDGHTILTSTLGGDIQVWDVDKGIAYDRSHAPGMVSAVALTPDGTQLAFGAGSTVLLLNFGPNATPDSDGNDGQALQGHQDAISSMTFCSDGLLLATGSFDNSIRIWDVNTYQELHVLEGHENAVLSVAFSPDVKLLASASSDNTIKIWDVGTGKLKKTLTGHTDEIRAVAFSHDGKLLVSGGKDNTVRVWEASSGKLKSVLHGNTVEVRSVIFGVDNNLVIAGTEDGTLWLWNAKTGESISSIPAHENSIESLLLNRAGTRLFTVGRDGMIQVWSLPSATP